MFAFRIWAWLLDRCQKRLEIVVIDQAAFFLRPSKSFPLLQVCRLFKEFFLYSYIIGSIAFFLPMLTKE